MGLLLESVCRYLPGPVTDTGTLAPARSSQVGPLVLFLKSRAFWYVFKKLGSWLCPQ